MSAATSRHLRQRIDAATRLIERDPGAALPESEAVYRAAQDAEPSLRASAAYVLGRAKAMTGDQVGARRLVEEAGACWRQAGEPLQALRTRAGLMQLLTADGGHAEAIALGTSSLAELRELDPADRGEVEGILHQNIGVAAAHGGAFDEALDAYDRAELAFRTADRSERLPALAANRAAELLDLGRLEEATTVLDDARSAARLIGAEVLVARCSSMLGWARALAGDVDRGIADLEQACDRFDELGLSADRDLAARRIGEAHLLLSDWPAALATFQRVLDHVDDPVGSYDGCAATTGIAAALLGEGETGEAEVALRRAIGGWRRLEHVPGLVGALVELAGVELLKGSPDAALGVALEASDLLDDAGVDEQGASRWPVQRLYADLRLVDTLLTYPEAAAPIAEVAVTRADAIGIPLLRCRAVRRLATVRFAEGAVIEAEALFSETVAIGELLRERLPREAQRRSFGDEVDAALIALTRIRLDEGTGPAVVEAAALADRRRDRVLSELVDGSLRPDELDLPPELLQLRATVGAASDALLDEGQGPRASALREHVVMLAGQLRRSAPPATTPVGPVDGPPGDRRAGSDATVTTLAYTDLDGEIVAFVTRNGWTRAIRAVSERGALLRLLEDLDGELWGGGIDAGTGPNAAELVQSANDVLRELGRVLLDPAIHLLSRGSVPRRLAVVPHGVLHDVPFHALITRDGPLIDVAAVTVCPNAAFAAPTASSAPTSVLTVGVPTADTPGIVDELAAFPALGLTTEILVGRDATREALQRRASEVDIVHLACHGQFDPELPSLSRLRLADGWLPAQAIAQLQLEGKLVVLSACDSARSGYRGPGGQTLGVTRALLAAGARCVVASRWLLSDEHASTTIAAFARHLMTTQDPALALRLAQLEQRRSTPHPAHWAPFAVVGRPQTPEVP
jgi:tetratricopeptide (TPR) repeat protein